MTSDGFPYADPATPGNFAAPRQDARQQPAAVAGPTHVFAGAPDGRQSAERIEVSRFRPAYRALDDREKDLHDAIKSKAAELEALYLRVPAGRYLALGMTALEESVMWTVKQLTS